MWKYKIRQSAERSRTTTKHVHVHKTTTWFLSSRCLFKHVRYSVSPRSTKSLPRRRELQKTKAFVLPFTVWSGRGVGGQQPCRRGVKTWQGLNPGQRAHHCQHHDTHWAARRHSPAWPAAVPAAPSVTVWLVLLSSPSPPCPIAICSPNKMAAAQHRARRPATCQCPRPRSPQSANTAPRGWRQPSFRSLALLTRGAGYAPLFAVGWYTRFPPTWFAAVWWRGRLRSPRQPPSGVGLHLLALLFIFRFSTFQGIVILYALARGWGKAERRAKFNGILGWDEQLF